MPTYQTAIVVGASSGLGRAVASQLAEQGCKVAAVARRGDRLAELAAAFSGKIVPYAHDVTRYDEVPELFERIVADLGGLDLIVYASGVMPEVGHHEYSFDKDRQIFEVNVLGAMAWLDQAAIRFEGTKRGTMIAIGSVAGDRGRSGQPAYNASKAALAAFVEGLRNRLARYGVVVSTVKPGPLDTEMTRRLRMKGAMTAETAAKLTLAKGAKTGEHYLKPAHRVAFYVIKRIPSPIFRRLNV